MKKFLVSFFLVGVTYPAAFSQGSEEQAYKYSNLFDLGLGTSGGKFSTALSWHHLHGVALKQKLKLGYGVRFTGFVAANKYYTTAPAKFTSPVQNLGTIFSTTIEENIDTITTATAFTNSVNIALYIEYSIIERLDVGFNIDAIGFSFGPQKQFNIISSSFDANQAPVVTGSPTKFNVLLTSDNDIGSLNSEFYAKYWFTDKIAVRAGLAFLFSEYRTDRELSFNNGQIVNDRFRYKAAMALLAVTYKPFN